MPPTVPRNYLDWPHLNGILTLPYQQPTFPPPPPNHSFHDFSSADFFNYSNDLTKSISNLPRAIPFFPVPTAITLVQVLISHDAS